MVNAISFARFGWRTCAQVFSTNKILALKTLFNPVRSGYIRYFEFPYIISQLPVSPALKVLDLSSPKHLALYTADTNPGWRLHAVDLDSSMFPDYRQYIDSMGLGNILLGKMDGVKLPYADNTFDAIFSVSVIEHFYGNGDSLVVKEAERILRPGGVFIFTVPYGESYQEIYWDKDVYSRKYSDEKLFFCRIYDNDTLRRRIVSQSAMKELDRRFIGQTRIKSVELEKLWGKTPRLIRMPLQLFLPVISPLFYGQVEENTFTSGVPGVALLTLRKPL